MPQIAGIILAAGKGTRMKSDRPKGLFEICGLPMVEHIGRAMREAGVARPIVVIGHGRELMRQTLGEDYDFAVQEQQLGTGHAAMMASPFLQGFSGQVLIVPGDAPLLTGEVLIELVRRHRESGAKCAVASVRIAEPQGYGRIVRDSSGALQSIVEDKDAKQIELALDEVNTGVYCFEAEVLSQLLPRLDNQNAQGEYYLTDLIAICAAEGQTLEACLFPESEIFMGVNDRWQLAKAAAVLRQRTLKRHALAGVSIIDPSTTFIGPDVEIGPETTIEPMTSIQGLTTIGSHCSIGPSSDINDCEIADSCTILMSKLDHAVMREGSRCGPFAHLRRGSIIGAGARVGNYVEVKNSELGEKASAAHLSYIGDSTVGARTNIGAGTITCNYDGFSKNRTEIGENAFVGSNSTLVAPVTIGEGAMIAAGSVINRDVPADALGVGRGRQEVKEEWAAQWRQKKKAEKESTAN